MDGFDEKKWFIFLSDHHEGPFSLADLQAKMSEGTVSAGTFIWCEGMPDWKVLKEVPTAASVLLSQAPEVVAAPPPSPTPAAEPSLVSDGGLEPSAPLEPSLSSLQVGSQSAAPTGAEFVQPEVAVVAAPANPGKIFGEPGTDTRFAIEASKQPKAPAGATSKPLRERRKLPVKLIGLVLVVAGAGVAKQQGLLEPVLENPGVKAVTGALSDLVQPYLFMAAEKLPALSTWISPVPNLTDVAPNDLADLKKAAMTPLSSGPTLAFALSKTNLSSPMFYVASNLPDGTSFEVDVEGVPDTLLNEMDYLAQTHVVMKHRFVQTVGMRAVSGKSFPQGSYFVHVFESQTQPAPAKSVIIAAPPTDLKLPAKFPKNLKLVSVKTYFLGATKDAIYQDRLNEFHKRVRAQAAVELGELKQFAETLSAQFENSGTTYRLIRSKRNIKAHLKTWNDYHAQWMKLDGSLGQTFNKWTQEDLKSRFYAGFYEATHALGQAVSEVHGLHHAYFVGAYDKVTYDKMLAEKTAQTQLQIANLKGRLIRTETVNLQATGLPSRGEP